MSGMYIPEEREPEPCTWTWDDDGYWRGDCEIVFFFDSGDPKDNGFNYCPKCGCPLEQEEVADE